MLRSCCSDFNDIRHQKLESRKNTPAVLSLDMGVLSSDRFKNESRDFALEGYHVSVYMC